MLAKQREANNKLCSVLLEIQHSTDPFADLSVNEDQVIQSQDHLR